jgi:hypothetical protein
MKRTNIHIFGILMLALAVGTVIPGCSTSTTPVTTPSQVNYTQAATYTYLYNSRSNSDMVDTTIATDTIKSTVLVANTSYQGMSNVTIIRNVHSNGSNPDTTYIAQNNGEFWHYNYGLEAINNNTSITALIGGQIQIGWVLQAKLNSVVGDTWTAANDSTLSIDGLTARVKITSVEQADTSITVSGNSVFSKHVTHTVTITSALTTPIVSTVDAYVATSVGVTFNVVHSANISASFYTGPVKGNQTLMINHS